MRNIRDQADADPLLKQDCILQARAGTRRNKLIYTVLFAEMHIM
jgi:hypothetical protein